MSGQAGWDGILDPGEKILWQGRPDPAFCVSVGNIAMAVFGVFFASFATFWMVMASQAPGPFWMFGLIFFFAGLGIVIGAVVGPTYRRRHTWYTLTDQRAFVATDLPLLGRKLESFPINARSPLSLQEGRPGSVHFAEKTKRGKNGPYTVQVGFERIGEARDVYALLRQIQRRDETGGAS